MTILALIFGLAGLVSQPQALPQDFLDGAATRSEPVVVDGFIGIEWTCEVVLIDGKAAKPSEIAKAQGQTVATLENEMCYSGIETETGRPVTGP